MEKSTPSAVPGNDPEQDETIDPQDETSAEPDETGAEPDETTEPGEPAGHDEKIDRHALSDTGQYQTGMALRLPRQKKPLHLKLLRQKKLLLPLKTPSNTSTSGFSGAACSAGAADRMAAHPWAAVLSVRTPQHISRQRGSHGELHCC